MKFYYFHLMPYIIDHDEPSSWVTLSNRHYDPAVGHTLYHQYLDQLEYAEKLGWDGVCVNEHHQNCYGTMPSPNVIGVAVHLVSGDHQSIVRAPHVQDLAEQLRHCLDEATTDTRTTEIEIPLYRELHPA